MRKFYWMLALPYVVTVSSAPSCDSFTSTQAMLDSGEGCGWVHAEIKDTRDVYNFPFQECNVWGCVDYLKDIAATLNEAHERRTKKEIPCPENTQCIDMGNVKDLHWKDSKKAETVDGGNLFYWYKVAQKRLENLQDCRASLKAEGTEHPSWDHDEINSKKAEWAKPLTVTGPTGNPKQDKDLISVHVTNQQACGQDDCGADPK